MYLNSEEPLSSIIARGKAISPRNSIDNAMIPGYTYSSLRILPRIPKRMIGKTKAKIGP